MGLHATPSLAPGGWVAFRPSEPEGQTPSTWIGDYSFLMRRLLGVPQDTSVGLEKCASTEMGPPLAWAGKAAVGAVGSVHPNYPCRPIVQYAAGGEESERY